MKKKSIIIFSFFAVLFSSCSKDGQLNSNTIKNNSGTVNPDKIISVGGSITLAGLWMKIPQKIPLGCNPGSGTCSMELISPNPANVDYNDPFKAVGLSDIYTDNITGKSYMDVYLKNMPYLNNNGSFGYNTNGDITIDGTLATALNETSITVLGGEYAYHSNPIDILDNQGTNHHFEFGYITMEVITSN